MVPDWRPCAKAVDSQPFLGLRHATIPTQFKAHQLKRCRVCVKHFTHIITRILVIGNFRSISHTAAVQKRITWIQVHKSQLHYLSNVFKWSKKNLSCVEPWINKKKQTINCTNFMSGLYNDSRNISRAHLVSPRGLVWYRWAQLTSEGLGPHERLWRRQHKMGGRSSARSRDWRVDPFQVCFSVRSFPRRTQKLLFSHCAEANPNYQRSRIKENWVI